MFGYLFNGEMLIEVLVFALNEFFYLFPDKIDGFIGEEASLIPLFRRELRVECGVSPEAFLVSWIFSIPATL